MKVLLTGIAGFIGMHCAERLAGRGAEVIGVDCLTPYYSVELKEARLARLAPQRAISIHRIDLADAGAFGSLFAAHRPAS